MISFVLIFLLVVVFGIAVGDRKVKQRYSKQLDLSISQVESLKQQVSASCESNVNSTIKVELQKLREAIIAYKEQDSEYEFDYPNTPLLTDEEYLLQLIRKETKEYQDALIAVYRRQNHQDLPPWENE